MCTYVHLWSWMYISEHMYKNGYQCTKVYIIRINLFVLLDVTNY